MEGNHVRKYIYGINPVLIVMMIEPNPRIEFARFVLFLLISINMYFLSLASYICVWCSLRINVIILIA